MFHCRVACISVELVDLDVAFGWSLNVYVGAASIDNMLHTIRVYFFFQNIVVHSVVPVVKICCIELYASISDSMGSRMSICLAGCHNYRYPAVNVLGFWWLHIVFYCASQNHAMGSFYFSGCVLYFFSSCCFLIVCMLVLAEVRYLFCLARS